MVFGTVASDGKKDASSFFQKTEVLPWLNTNYLASNYVWTLDATPANTEKKVHKLCNENFTEFWLVNFWPLSCSDPKPLNFAIWGTLEYITNGTSHPIAAHLKETLVLEWEILSEDFIFDSSNAFRRRVQAVINKKGGHIE